MDEAGLWRLFYLTGLPQAWLAIRGQRGEKSAPAAAAMAPRREKSAPG